MSEKLEELIQDKIRELVLARHEAITSHKLAEEEALVATQSTTEALKEMTVVPEQEIDLIAQSVRAAFTHSDDFKPAGKKSLADLALGQIKKDREQAKSVWNYFVEGTKKRGLGFQVPLLVFSVISLITLAANLATGADFPFAIFPPIVFLIPLGVLWLATNPDNKDK